MKKLNSLIAETAINAARAHLGKGAMVDSAEVAIDDALKCFLREDFYYAAERALDSLSYSVGIFHTDHARIRSILKGVS